MALKRVYRILASKDISDNQREFLLGIKNSH